MPVAKFQGSGVGKYVSGGHAFCFSCRFETSFWHKKIVGSAPECPLWLRACFTPNSSLEQNFSISSLSEPSGSRLRIADPASSNCKLFYANLSKFITVYICSSRPYIGNLTIRHWTMFFSKDQNTCSVRISQAIPRNSTTWPKNRHWSSGKAWRNQWSQSIVVRWHHQHGKPFQCILQVVRWVRDYRVYPVARSYHRKHGPSSMRLIVS